jgi:hypothetical protein
MQPGFRTQLRAKPQNALETLFADEDARAATAKVAPEPKPQADEPDPNLDLNPNLNLDLDLDLQPFADELKLPPKPSGRFAWPALFGSSPVVVALLVALFSITPPLLLSRHSEPERSSPLAVIAQDAGELKASSPEPPVATTSETITVPYTPPAPPERIAEPPAPAKRAAPKVTPPPVRETSRAPVSNTPAKSAYVSPPPPPPRPAVIPTLQPASRTIDTLGTLPVSLVSAPAPAPTLPAVDVRAKGPIADPVDERANVLATLRRYESAYSALDARAVRTVWPTVNQGALSRAFESLASQNIRLGNCAVTVRAPTARAVCAGTATWVPRIGGGKQREDRRTWTFSLAQRDQSWSIVSAEMR